jgi:TolA-binding protein
MQALPPLRFPGAALSSGVSMTPSVRLDEVAARGSASSSETSALHSLREAAFNAGLDPVAELYNEALELAQEGHYGQAQQRLNVLLGIAPADGEGHLLLAKVLVAGQQWRRALQALDEASQCGTTVPEELRAAVLRNLHADEEGMDEQSASRQAREQGEITRLRSEARRLRGENAQLVSRAAALEKETTRWAWVATGTSTVAIAFVLARMLWAPAAPADVAQPAAALTAGAQPAAAASGTGAAPGAATAADPASPRNGSLAEQAGAALMSAGVMEGAQLEVTVRGSGAQLSGYAPTYAKVKKAAGVVAKVPGVESVGTAGVIILAVRDGTKHTVQPGENLGQIAFDHYGKSSLHDKVLAANPALGDARNLKVGMELVIPPIRE